MDSKSKFTELMAVRLTKEELARLQEAADDQSIGASTLVRILVNQALKPVSAKPRRMTAFFGPNRPAFRGYEQRREWQQPNLIPLGRSVPEIDIMSSYQPLEDNYGIPDASC